MTILQTLSIIKPDATIRNLTGEINAMIEKNGLQIIAQKRLLLTKKQAQMFYAEHQGREFFEPLVEFMISAPIIVQVLQGEDAIEAYRKLMGGFGESIPGTIRHNFALSSRQNSVHGSDSVQSAQREISFFFSQIELLPHH